MPQPFPLEMKIKIFEDMINSARTLPECDNLFKALILINKDLAPEENNYNIRYFRSMLFTKLALKKYTILCEIERQFINAGCGAGYEDFDIINKGINIKKFYGLAPLHYANNGLVAELLIENGAYIDSQDNGGWAPIHYAAARGKIDVAEQLISHGAHFMTISSYGSPLQMATVRKHHGMETFLREKQQDPLIPATQKEVTINSWMLPTIPKEKSYKPHIILAICAGIIICTCWVLKKRIQTLLSKIKEKKQQTFTSSDKTNALSINMDLK